MAQNKYDMSVTPEVSHVEMWPSLPRGSVLGESQATTAVLMVLSSCVPPQTSAAGLEATPHDVDAHWVPENVPDDRMPSSAPAGMVERRGKAEHGLHAHDPVPRPTADVLVKRRAP